MDEDGPYLGQEECDDIARIEQALCRCVERPDGTWDAARCMPHNDRFHSMEGLDLFDSIEDEPCRCVDTDRGVDRSACDWHTLGA